MAEPMEVDDAPRSWNFPLFQLPEKILRRVLEMIDCVDLIDLSLCSRRSKQLTQSINHGIDAIDLSVMALNTMIMLRSGQESRGIIDFESTLPPCLPVLIRFINKRYINVCKQSEMYYCRNAVTSTLPIKTISNYLTGLFKAPLNIVLIPMGIPNLTSIFPAFTKCETLEISGAPFIQPTDLKHVLENVKPDKRFTLNVRHNSYFFPPEVPLFFDVDNLEMLGTAEWMTSEIFLRLSCNRIRLSFCHLKGRDLEAFVTQWFFGNSNHLEYVEIWHKVSPEPMLFRNCDVRKWDSFRRARFYNNTPLTYIDCASGFDIIRRDGAIATVVMFPGSFHFIVWKDPFPPLAGFPQILA